MKRGEHGRPNTSARSSSPKGVKTTLLSEPEVDATEGGLNGVPGLPLSSAAGEGEIIRQKTKLIDIPSVFRGFDHNGSY